MAPRYWGVQSSSSVSTSDHSPTHENSVTCYWEPSAYGCVFIQKIIPGPAKTNTALTNTNAIHCGLPLLHGTGLCATASPALFELCKSVFWTRNQRPAKPWPYSPIFSWFHMPMRDIILCWYKINVSSKIVVIEITAVRQTSCGCKLLTYQAPAIPAF